jgi:ribosome biogenesis GTPase
MNPSLDALGWTADRSQHLSTLNTGATPARVVRASRDRFLVEGPTPGAARHAGALRSRDRPAVGDWVLVDARPGDTLLTVVDILPRRSWLGRRAAGSEHRGQLMATNLDQVWVVAGLDRDQGLRSLRRYLTLIRDGGARPLVVLNKVDLHPDPLAARLAAEAEAGDAEVVAVSALSGDLGPLEERLRPAATFCLVGPSGVGKSTLCNRLLGRERIATGAVRESDARGRHTTTERAMHRLEGGALLIDTPGLREIGLWLEGDGLERSFAEITALAERCRFRDCSHDNEPGCAVREALAQGEIPSERFLAWLELQAEAQAQRQRAGASNSKRRFEEISRQVRRHKKRYDKRR